MTSHKFSVFLLASAIALLTILSSCALPVASAQDRTFLNLSLDFLSEYQLPEQTFKDTPIGELSALAYDRQRDLFYAVSDDQSRSAPARFYTLKLTLNSLQGLPIEGLPEQTTVTNPQSSNPVQPAPLIGIRKIDIEDVTFLRNQDGKTYPENTIDPEGIALSPQQSVFVSSEGVVRNGIPPFINEFDLETGRLRQSLPIPQHYIPDAIGEKQQRGIQDNLAFESLTLSPVGYLSARAEPFRLFTATESALVQDLDPTAVTQLGAKCRLLHYLLSDGPPLLISEHLYQLDSFPSGIVDHGLADLLALDQSGHFLSLERFLSPSGFSAKIFQLATGGATDISQIASLKGKLAGVEPVKKKLLLDLSQLDITLGKLEGMTLGPRLPDGTQSLVLLSDNDFSDAQVTQFLLFRLRRQSP